MILAQKEGIFSLNIKGKLLSLEYPILMGIINLTPDSFYDGSKDINTSSILKKIEQMIEHGATIIDIGAMSSRPFSKELTINEEKERLKKFLPHIIKEFKETIFSIDTYRSEIAEYAINEGCSIVNDISAGRNDEQILNIAAKYKTPYILMHMQGNPENMQLNPEYESIISEISMFFSSKIKECKEKGILDIILDVGFGFGKSIDDNFKLLKHLEYFNMFQCPILTGISRKSMIYNSLNITPAESLNGTSALHFEALKQGSKILRVHDVKEAKEVIELYNIYKKQD